MVSGLRQRRVGSSAICFLLAIEAIGEASQLAAVTADEQVQAIEIGKFVVALARPGAANTRVVQHGILVLASRNEMRFRASNRTRDATAANERARARIGATPSFWDFQDK